MADIYVSQNGDQTQDSISEPPSVTPPTKTEEGTVSGIAGVDIFQLGKAKFSSSLVPLPTNIHFETQDETEKIILLMRQHWATNVTWVITAIFLILAPLILGKFPILNFLPLRYQTMSVILWYLLVSAFIFEQFLDWYFNVYIVTNERIIDYDFYNLTYKNITQADLSQIQEVSVKVIGVPRIFLDFGDVYIETASETPNLVFDAVPDPEYVSKVIHEISEHIQKKSV